MDDARRLASDSKKLLDAVQADHRRQIAAQSKTTVEAIDGRLKQYDMTVSGYSTMSSTASLTKYARKRGSLRLSPEKIQRATISIRETESWEPGKGGFRYGAGKNE